MVGPLYVHRLRPTYRDKQMAAVLQRRHIPRIIMPFQEVDSSTRGILSQTS